MSRRIISGDAPNLVTTFPTHLTTYSICYVRRIGLKNNRADFYMAVGHSYRIVLTILRPLLELKQAVECHLRYLMACPANELPLLVDKRRKNESSVVVESAIRA